VVNKERVKRGDPESKLKIDNKQLEKKVADRAALVTNADGTRRAEGNQHIMIANLDRTDMEACFNLDDAKKIIKPSSWIEVRIDGEAEPVVFSPKPSPYNGGLSINKFASALVNNYKPAFLYFEIFECLYKVSIVGLMIFYNAGTIEQHILGLLICFVAACTYNNLKPYNKVVNNWTQQIAQFAIVITLLMAMVKCCIREVRCDRLAVRQHGHHSRLLPLPVWFHVHRFWVHRRARRAVGGAVGRLGVS